jgi:hypothetical protein
MAQLLKHYWADRDNISQFLTTPEHYSRPMAGSIAPNIEGLEIVYRLSDVNGVQFCLSTCPDETVITETEGLSVITQQQWDNEIASYDQRQEEKRWDIVRKYRNILLNQTDWIVVKSSETETPLSIEFKSWRQSLRDLPESEIFPTSFPTPPSEVNIDETLESSYVSELRSVTMINDPLPSLLPS